MSEIDNLNYHSLISSKDQNPSAKSYIKYQAIDEKFFFAQPTYIYNRKVAFVNLKPFQVFLIDNFDIFLMHSNQFDLVWDLVRNKPHF